MSFWINRYRCRSCGSEMNVQGGMVNTTWMGPVENVPCINHNCSSQYPDGFENMGSIDFNNPEHDKNLIRHLDNGNGD